METAKRGLLTLIATLIVINATGALLLFLAAKERGLDWQKLTQVVTILLFTAAVTPIVVVATLKRHGYEARDILRLHEIIGKTRVRWWEAREKRKEWELSNDLGFAIFLPIFAGWILAVFTVYYGGL
ncbi:MAG: hypothetical protein ABWW66_04815 [Archaeoglobaceae archaeon]